MASVYATLAKAQARLESSLGMDSFMAASGFAHRTLQKKRKSISFAKEMFCLKTGLSSRSNDPSSNEKILPFILEIDSCPTTQHNHLTTSSNSWSNGAHELVILHLKLCKCPCCIRQILRGKSLHFENLTPTPRMTMSLRTSPHDRGVLLQAVNSLKMINTNANTCRFAPQYVGRAWVSSTWWLWVHNLAILDLIYHGLSLGSFGSGNTRAMQQDGPAGLI